MNPDTGRLRSLGLDVNREHDTSRTVLNDGEAHEGNDVRTKRWEAYGSTHGGWAGEIGFLNILLEDSLCQFHDAALHVGIVGNWPANRHLASPLDRDALPNQGAGINQKPGAHAFLKPVILEIAHFPSELDKTAGELSGYARFTLHDPRFDFSGRIVELDGHETLFGAWLQILEHALIAGIVGNHEQEVVGRFA